MCKKYTDSQLLVLEKFCSNLRESIENGSGTDEDLLLREIESNVLDGLIDISLLTEKVLKDLRGFIAPILENKNTEIELKNKPEAKEFMCRLLSRIQIEIAWREKEL